LPLDELGVGSVLLWLAVGAFTGLLVGLVAGHVRLLKPVRSFLA